MKLLNKLPNSRREPPGLERSIFRKLPKYLAGGTLVPVFVSIATRLFPPEGTSAQIAKHVATVDIFAIASVITAWTAVFTVAIGCVVVMLMKGPGYVADAYDLVDSDHPKER